MPKQKKKQVLSDNAFSTNESIEAFRHAVFSRIDAILKAYIEKYNANFTKIEGLQPACNIERGIYNASIQKATQMNIVRKWTNPRFVDIYRQRVKSVISNLDTTSYVHNEHLIVRLLNNEMMPHELAFMKPVDLFPERWISAQEQIKCNETDFTPTKFVTLYKCGKCGQNKTTVHELQTRSADEPMTLFITCFNCKHKGRG